MLGGAAGPSYLRLEAKLQTKLNQAGKIDGIGYNAKVLIVVRTASSVRRSELGMVKEIEKLGTKFDIHSLSDGRFLEHGEVEVDHALLPERSIDARLIAEAIARGVSEAAGVEPTGKPCHSAAGG